MNKKRKVVFLLAPSFHGATLLSLIIGNHSKIVSLGDTLPSIKFDQTCGCGRKVSACDFWKNLSGIAKAKGRDHLFLEYPQISTNEKINQATVFGMALLLNKLSIRWNGVFSQQYQLFFDYVTDYYNKTILLDGNKSIYRYLAVKASGHYDVSVIHLARDPRAFTVSVIKKHGISIDQAIKIYKTYHNRTMGVLSFLNESAINVRYEDLLHTPEIITEKIMNNIGVNNEAVIHVLDSNLHWMGNRSLFKFTGEIYNNEKWRNHLSKSEGAYILDKTKTLCKKFNYYE